MAEFKEDISKTVDEGKRWANLLKDYSKMEIIDKGSSIISTLILIIVLIALLTIAIFCLCMALYHCLLTKTADPVLSYSIIALSLIFVCSLILLLRKKIIENPLIRYLSNIFFKNDK